jgi:PAS domain S-box-containing protein
VVIDRPEDIALAELHAQRNLTLAGLVAGILAACFMATVMAGKIASPLRALASATDRLANGDISAPLAKAGVSEITGLSAAFDAMRHRLAERTEQRDRANAALVDLNRDLEARVRERTAELQAEIAHRRDAEQQTREAYETLSAVIRSSPLPILRFDTAGIITAWNPAAERVFGWSEREVLGRFNPVIPEDQVLDFLAMVECASNGELIADYETRRQTKDRGPIEVSLSLSSIRDQAGAAIGFLSILTDITERKRLAEQLRHTQKLESLGLLAGGVAHDFNNLLVGVIGNASLAQEMLPPSHPAAELLDGVLKTGEQAAHLTRQMLAYSGKGRFMVEALDLSALIPEMSGLVRPSIPKKIALRFDLDPDLPAIEADRGQVQQVFMNLAINAAEAIGSHDGLISVSTGVRDVDEPYIRLHPGTEALPPGRYVCLEVRDTGCGMRLRHERGHQSQDFRPLLHDEVHGAGAGAGSRRGHRARSQRRDRRQQRAWPGELLHRAVPGGGAPC